MLANMRSKAAIKAHPIHPALVPYPFAFLSGALLFDVLAVLSGRAAFHLTAEHLTVAGIAAGVLAAIPGVIDYVYTLPPNSSGKKRATTHALLNVSALVVFGAAWFLREADAAASIATLGLELIGTGALFYSGLARRHARHPQYGGGRSSVRERRQMAGRVDCHDKG